MVELLLLGIGAAGLAFALFSLIMTVAAGIRTAPYVPTPIKAARRALELAGLEPGELFLDLGCGNGRVLVLAAREFGAQAVGYELSPHRALIGWANIALQGLRGMAVVHYGDLFQADVSRADLVFLWLTPRAAALEEKLLHELRPRTRVVIFSTPVFKVWQPDRVLQEEGGRPIYLYRVPADGSLSS